MFSRVETVHPHENKAEDWKSLASIGDRWRADRLLARRISCPLRLRLSSNTRTTLSTGRTWLGLVIAGGQIAGGEIACSSLKDRLLACRRCYLSPKIEIAHR